jgi:hypothetical protein
MSRAEWQAVEEITSNMTTYLVGFEQGIKQNETESMPLNDCDNSSLCPLFE